MHSYSKLLAPLAALMMGASALDAAGWRNQTIYQVITDRFSRADNAAPLCDSSAQTFCGGSWKGITNRLDYIQNMGFSAVWISPISKNVEGNFGLKGEAYHGFWTQDLYTLNPHFGTEADLKELSDQLHARGMYLMIDVVPNHVGLNVNPGNYVQYTPFNDAKYYHKECTIRWKSVESQRVCWLEGLPDLRTEDEEVRKLYREWIADVVKKYGIDGLRVDTGEEIEPEFWTEGGFAKAAGVYLLAEITYPTSEQLAPYQKYVDGFMDYPTYTPLRNSFAIVGRNFKALYEVTNTIASMQDVDPSLWGSFLENQDQVRFGSLTGDIALAKNVIAHLMLRDAIPIIYYGQEQRYAGGARPFNREALWLGIGYDESTVLYRWIHLLNKIRRQAAKHNPDFLTKERIRAIFYYNRSNTIIFKKGQMLSFFTNVGTNRPVGTTVYRMTPAVSGYKAHQCVVDVANCHRFTVDQKGYLKVWMPADGLPRVFLPEEQTEGLCANITEPVAVDGKIVNIKPLTITPHVTPTGWPGSRPTK